MVERLHLWGIEAQIVQIGRGWTLPDWPKSEIVIFHRVPYDRYVARGLEVLRRRQAVLIFSTDDLTFEPDIIPHLGDPAFKRRFQAASYHFELSGQRQLMRECDAVIVATPFLARFARRYHPAIWIHRTGFSMEMLAASSSALAARSPHPQDRVVLGYASGTPSHDRDFAQIETPLQKLLDCYPQVAVHVVGPVRLPADWSRFGERLKRIEYVPWRRLPDVLVRFDVNLAPLEVGNPACEAKSELKYVEAGLLQVPTVASPVEAFRSAIRPGYNGLLAATEAEWASALAHLIEQPDVRRGMGENALRDVVSQYHPRPRGRELLATLTEIMALPGISWTDSGPTLHVTAEEPSCSDLPRYVDERAAPLWARLSYALRFRGLRIALIQGWEYVVHRRRR
jgi:glycosyltransferase involved in cell wall biosynthesis